MIEHFVMRNFRVTCSSDEMLKQYMVRERLGTPVSCSQNRKKKFFVFGGGISGGDVTKKACFGNFGHL